MENIHEVGVAAYRAADEVQPPLTGGEQMQAVTSFLFKVVKYLVLAFFAWCQVIKEVFVPPPRQSVKGKIALVTGGANGLGRATCLRLAKEGCNIAIVDVDNENIKRTVEELRALKVTAMGYRVDITDCEAVKGLRKSIISDMGGVVDILINNAGVLPKVSLLEGTEKDIDRIVDVNFRSHFWTIRTFLPDMITKRSGRICGVSSLCGVEAQPRMVAYSATKFAVSGLMDGVHEELATMDLDNDIITSTVYPYFIATRQDLIDSLKEMPVSTRIPTMTPTYCAEIIVDGLLRNQHKIYIPPMLQPFFFFHQNSPFRLRKLMKQIFIEEK